ncbi:ATP-dependent helicase [Thermodesulfovibrio hydrogeniphilus]
MQERSSFFTITALQTINLNSEQYQAVTHINSPVLVVAGAGSGKTRVITAKVLYLIEQGIAPERILAITFTRKAAEEMKKRVQDTLGVRPPYILTFHSFCLKFLKEELPTVSSRYTKDFVIYDEHDSITIIENIIEQFEYSRLAPETVAASISKAKQRYINGSDLSSYLKTAELISIYKEYQKQLVRSNAMDYDDLLYHTVRILLKYPKIRDKWNSAFDYILVDEYQDTNEIQYQLLQLLTTRHKNITVVGDPQQSIYGFRGACVGNVKKFVQDFNPKIVKLGQNYRSTPSILNIANRISSSMNGFFKELLVTLYTENKDDGEVAINVCEREEEFIAKKILELTAKGIKYQDIAILIRVSFLSFSIEKALARYGIPYRVLHGIEFFSRSEIKNLLMYLRFLINNKDTVAFQRIINIPKGKIGKRKLRLIEQHYESSWI